MGPHPLGQQANERSEPSRHDLRSAIEALFPRGIICIIADEEMYRSPLFPDEEEVVRLASPSRSREFRAGRAAARAALGGIGLRGCAIPAGSDRAPIWPRGVVGSISHSRSLCAVVVGRDHELRAVGLDVEEMTAIPPLVVPEICGPEDIAQAVKLSADLAPLLPNIIFGAKEAFYKAYYPLTRRFLEFNDVTVLLRQEGSSYGSFTIRPCRPDLPLSSDFARFEGRWRVHPPVVLAGAVFPASGASNAG